jgi:uncharacterized protein YqgV (UPF0045/DUF77 family)
MPAHMTISVEISLYPLADKYVPAIDGFIKSLYNYPGLYVHTSHLSTMVVGEYALVMEALQSEIFNSLQSSTQASFVLKILKGDATKEVNLDGYR